MSDQTAEINEFLVSVGDQLDNVLDANPHKYFQKIKWQLDFTNKRLRNEAVPFNPDNVAFQLDGLLRAGFSEELSEMYRPQGLNCVFVSKQDLLDGIQSEAPQKYGKSKESILKNLVAKSLEEAELHDAKRILGGVIKNPETLEKVMNEIKTDFFEGYGSKPEGRETGLLYSQSTIPDGLLMNKQKECVGFVEVKAYTPEEFESMVEKLEEQKGALKSPSCEIGVNNDKVDLRMQLGVDVAKEAEFVDIFRGVGFGQKGLSNETLVLLRFPSDISDDLLIRYGEILKRLNYTKVVIQKLPVTSSELSILAKGFVRRHLGKYLQKDNKLSFSQREIKVLEDYAGS